MAHPKGLARGEMPCASPFFMSVQLLRHRRFVWLAEDVQRPAQHTRQEGRGGFVDFQGVFEGDGEVAEGKNEDEEHRAKDGVAVFLGEYLLPSGIWLLDYSNLRVILPSLMPRRDIYHNQVRRALEKDGWTITHDPMRFRWKGRTLWPDLGIEKVIAAERGTEKIAVEIKSFTNAALLVDFYEALGQYDIYKAALSELDEERVVVLAVSQEAYASFLSTEFAQTVLQMKSIPILVYDTENETIVKWIEQKSTSKSS